MPETRVEVPEMVMLEILSKLPVKSLTRFRCVCKPWCSSFQTPHFITKHHRNNLHNNNLNLLLKRCQGNTRDDIYYFSQLSIEKGQNFSAQHNIHLPFFEDCWYAPVVSGPCNGLLCLHDADKVALWNPSTREFKSLPQSTVQRPPSVDSTSFDCFGIGFDSQSGDYKVFSTLPLPEFGGSLAEYYLELLDFNGLLGAIVYPRGGADKSFDLWVMNGSWTKQFSIESLLGVERPLGLWKNGELFLESSDHKLVLFDPSTRELKNLGIHAYQETMQIIAYVESLVPID
ncbi:hypothetical protein GOBAR_DD00064 [Gossypium barbadense]|nr:hypothetical protein GOBAR_DD00064 [Gossypium barbadense]